MNLKGGGRGSGKVQFYGCPTDIVVYCIAYLGSQRRSWARRSTRRSGGTGTYWPVNFFATLTFGLTCLHIAIMQKEQFYFYSYFLFLSLVRQQGRSGGPVGVFHCVLNK